MESYFVAYNESTEYYLRFNPDEQERNSHRPAFRATGLLAKFDSAFAVLEFFEGSRFDLSNVHVRRFKTEISDDWSIDELRAKKEMLFA